MSLARELMAGLSKMPVVAIVRGIEPDEVADVGDALFAAGIRIVEVPLNSPNPLASIRVLAERLGERCIIGAGTVLSAPEVDDVAKAGAQLIVSPNAERNVISRAIELGCVPVPGIATITEAFSAYAYGARFLKLFPARTYGPAHVKDLRAVLPSDANLLAIGGVSSESAAAWLLAGAVGVGMGSAIFRPGDDIDTVRSKATAATEAVNRKNEGKCLESKHT